MEGKDLPKKRRSRGRTKGKSRGRGQPVQCSACGKSVPVDKAKKIYRRTSLVEPTLARELRKKRVYLPSRQTIKWLCINCAIHRGYYSQRQKELRRKPYRKKSPKGKIVRREVRR